MEKKQVIVVTGSSGCLGQHIVKLLQEKDDGVTEIRLLDRRPYENKLGHKCDKPMKKYVGDVRDTSIVHQVLAGADCVIHAAALIDIGLFPDVREMKSINVDGTQVIIDACVELNVPNLVFASSTDAVIGSEHIFYGTESTTPVPSTFMIGPYGETKCEAEKLVLQATGRILADGTTKLRTAAIRSTPFYGEEDKVFFYSVMQYTKQNSGYYRRIRSLDERMQICYVGNAAWAHVKAKDKLLIDDSISGEAFFVTDDTPIIDIHEHLRPYLESRGFRVSDYVFPYWLAWILLSLICLVIRLLNTVVSMKANIPCVAQLNYMCSTFFFNRSKATLRLDYQPVYTPEEAAELSMKYYSKVEL